jgi:hypothetical protein
MLSQEISAVDSHPRKRQAVLDSEISYVDVRRRPADRLPSRQSDLVLPLAKHHSARQPLWTLPGA